MPWIQNQCEKIEKRETFLPSFRGVLVSRQTLVSFQSVRTETRALFEIITSEFETDQLRVLSILIFHVAPVKRKGGSFWESPRVEVK